MVLNTNTARRSLRQITLGGVRTDCLTTDDLTSLMVRDCAQMRAATEPLRPRLVFDVNGHAISLAATNTRYRLALSEADLVHADGQPLVLYSRLFPSSRIPHRTATTDLILDCAATAEQSGLRFYLLGGAEAVNAAAALELARRFPRLIICGRRNGFFDSDDEQAVCEEINATNPDVVWVGLGKPFEQDFCTRNAASISSAWMVTCGGCFNFLAGVYRRAPSAVQSLGLEWLHRMITNPNLS